MDLFAQRRLGIGGEPGAGTVSQCPPVIRRKTGIHHRNKNIDNSLPRNMIHRNMNMAAPTHNPPVAQYTVSPEL